MIGSNVRKGASMVAAGQLWKIIQGNVPRMRWVSSDEIYAIVERHGRLEPEDREPHFSGSQTPFWKKKVRSIMTEHVREGKVRSRETLKVH
jgi:hypothetical protein